VFPGNLIHCSWNMGHEAHLDNKLQLAGFHSVIQTRSMLARYAVELKLHCSQGICDEETCCGVRSRNIWTVHKSTEQRKPRARPRIEQNCTAKSRYSLKSGMIRDRIASYVCSRSYDFTLQPSRSFVNYKIMLCRLLYKILYITLCISVNLSWSK